jgi:hypothetical protein
MKTHVENPEVSGYTDQPLIVPAVVNGTIITPEFVRLPKARSRCPITGLSRTSLVELVDCGAVKAVKLRKKGSLRGITLLHRESLLGYLHALAA